MSKKRYIERESTRLIPQEFYIEFGFKTREYGEQEFRRAVNEVYAQTDDKKLKEFLFNEQIRDDFACLNENTCLDNYWQNTVKEAIASNKMKRKLDHIVYRQQPESSKPSLKDRRLSDTLSQNKITDLSNEGNSSQKITLRDFEKLLNDSDFEALPELHPKVIACVNDIFKSSQSSNYQKYLKSLPYHYQCPQDALYIYQIITLILHEHNIMPELFDMGAQSFDLSEQDFNHIWGPLIKILFSKTCVEVKSGDTVLSDIDQRLRIDYRLVVMVNHKFVDIASVEVGKRPNTSKVKEDYLKLVLEAKSIISRITN